VRIRTLVAAAAVFTLGIAPGAEAKFRIVLTLSAEVPAVATPVHISLRTDTTLPADHSLRLVAVAPGVEMYTAIKSLLIDPNPGNASGLHVWLARTGPKTWKATLSFPRAGRWLVVVPNWGPVGYALPPPVIRPVKVGSCPVTLPNGRTPAGERLSGGHHGNGGLFTVLWPRGTIRATPNYVGSNGAVEMKFPWWRGRGIHGALRITGRRLDGPASPLQAHIPSGYGPTGFQATGLVFATEGCWEVTGKAGKARLTFVARVVKTG
jgi:hypothetical protein